VEIKTGYGLDNDTELKMLSAILRMGDDVPMDIVPTYLGAHAVPKEFSEDTDGYTDKLCSEMLPSLKKWWESNAVGLRLPYVDVFCEKGAFNLTQSRRILETAKGLGFPLKIHADEFENLGGARLGAELGAVSADHLVTTSQEDIQALAGSDTVAVALPCTPFGLAEVDYTPAIDFLAAGGLLALATDTNPGTAWCESMQFAIALACRYMRLTPAQAIVAATINSAAAVGLADQIGTIEAGKQADVIILDIPEYKHLGYRFGTNLVHTVIKNGQLYPVKGS
jgi:imidazolonepropionase